MTPPLPTAVLLAALAALAACGADAPAEPAALPLLHESVAHAGDERTGAQVLVLALPGPELQLARPADVHVQLAAAATVHAHYAAAGTVMLKLDAAIGTSTVPVELSPAQRAEAAIAYDVRLRLPAGSHRLMAGIVVRAFDASGRATGALSTADAALQWRVQVDEVAP
jgi:hypothetical protein